MDRQEPPVATFAAIAASKPLPDKFGRFFQLFAQRPRITALLLGLVSALGFPPLGLWPFTVLALAGFIALLRQESTGKQAAFLGWIFGWSHLTVAIHWIATAFEFQEEMPSFLGWFAVPALCIYLAFYPALATWMTHWASRRIVIKPDKFVGNSEEPSAGMLGYGLLFSAFWILTEWLRSWVFTGYPWPPLGLAMLGDWDRPGLAILLPWLGTYALSGLVIVLAAILLDSLTKRRWIIGAITSVIIIAGMLMPAMQEQEQGTQKFTLVQPYIPQPEINDPSKFEQHFARLAEHTIDPTNPNRLILWPESAVPDYLRDGYPQRYYTSTTVAGDPEFARKRIGSLLGSNGLLLTGVVDLEIGMRGGRPAAVGAYNTVTSIDGEGNLGEPYAKAHLVPYGEYLALRWLLEPLGATRLVAGTIDFIPGPGPRTLDLGEHGKAGIQICYEIVFSGQVIDRDNRPDFIFNPSNDGWFGSWGPPQHLGQARMRAIEEGLPVLRSTTTGISAVIDANGTVRSHIASGIDDGIDGFIPPAKPPTLFARFGNVVPLGWALLLVIISFVALRRRAV